MERITLELGELVRNAHKDNIIDVINTISMHEDVVSSHKEWERADQHWKDVTKSKAEDSEIIAAAALVRETRKKKDSIADAAAILAREAAENSGILIDYDKDTLGVARQAGNVEELSPEWHNLRRGGVGGSTVSKVLGFHWKSHVGAPVYYDTDELQDIITDLAVEKLTDVKKVEDITSGVLFRGHQWEPALLAYFAATYKKKVGVSKATWRGREKVQVVNVDGIILDDDGNPEGIVECKTSSREWTWQWGVPIGYRAQTLWYLNATGLKYAYVVVRFDSGSFDIHKIEAGDTVDDTDNTKTIMEYFPEIYRVWETIDVYKEYPEDLWEDNSRLRKEELSTLGFVNDDGTLDGELGELIKDGVVVQASIVAPYERMDAKFSLPQSLVVDGKKFIMSDISPILFPVTVSTESHDHGRFITTSECVGLLGDSMIFAVDTPTYEWVCRTVGVDGVVNMSAVRRYSTLQPGLEDFEDEHDMVQWLEENAG